MTAQPVPWALARCLSRVPANQWCVGGVECEAAVGGWAARVTLGCGRHPRLHLEPLGMNFKKI